MRFIHFIPIVFVTCIFTSFTSFDLGAEEKTQVVELSARGKLILNRYKTDMAKAAANYAQSIDRAKTVAIRNLKYEVKVRTRAGEINEALQTQEQINKIEEDHATDLFGNPITNLPDGDRIKEAMRGKTVSFRSIEKVYTYTLHDDGTLTQTTPKGDNTAKWVTGPGKTGMYLIWNKGVWYDRIFLNKKGEITLSNPNGVIGTMIDLKVKQK